MEESEGRLVHGKEGEISTSRWRKLPRKANRASFSSAESGGWRDIKRDGVFVGAGAAHERECLGRRTRESAGGGARERVLKGALWKGALWKVCEERERAPRHVGRVGEWRERGRGKGPSPGRREPANLRASLRHEQARGTSSEAVALRDDAKGSRKSLSVSFMGFV